MTARCPLARAAYGLALIGVTEHCVADILCR
ncbi:Ms4533A family Cys-rich leader peptide [Streptomyces sp. NBC_01497]|nr:Ms4533A family Cys-rich leader peptide [Streptomyces sp. NBC_01497]